MALYHPAVAVWPEEIAAGRRSGEKIYRLSGSAAATCAIWAWCAFATAARALARETQAQSVGHQDFSDG
jgi:hypothetical protein